MAFYSESIYLDLKKNLHSFLYQPLAEGKDGEAEAGVYSHTEKAVTHEDLGSKAYLFFEEKGLVLEDTKNSGLYIQGLRKGIAPADFPFSNVIVRINFILHKYLEQPSLLDNLVEPILAHVGDAARAYLRSYYDDFKATGQIGPVHEEFRSFVSVVYILAKVRGTKNVQKYMGHDVMDLEPLVFFMLANHQTVNWETMFYMLLWLSVVLLAPFDFSRFDFQKIREFYAEMTEGKSFESIELLVLDFLKSLLKMSSRIAEGTSLCFSVLFRRPDLANVVYISDTIQWGLGQIRDPASAENSFYKANVYKALSGLVKDTKREVVELFHREIFEELAKISEERPTAEEPSNVRYEKVHFIFSVVLKLLRPNHTRPIYKTQRKRLMQDTVLATEKVPMITNKKEDVAGPHAQSAKPKAQVQLEEDSENIEFLPLIEHVVDVCLECLHDSDSAVRYLAAKDLASVALKLPQTLSDELLNVVLELLAEENEASLHSVCLTIGEFCRRGLISPDMLSRVIPVLEKAILFEEYQGNYSSGSIVRDAACYICWALAKAFEVEVMRPFVQKFANAVLICALFDKNANCRKAAAASFQENVGRQGYFPNGIEIISEMDYFSVSLRSNAYFKIAPFVGHFREYTRPFLTHLSTVKIFHIEKEIRAESAKSMALIALFDPAFALDSVLPALIAEGTNRAMQKRCGAVIGVACLLLSLSGNSQFMLEKEHESENIFLKSLKINDQKLHATGEYLEQFARDFEALKGRNQLTEFSADLARQIIGLPKRIIEAGLLKGKGGEITRIAIMYLISGISKARLELTPQEIEAFFGVIEEALRTTIYDIHDAAVEALTEFCGTYLTRHPDLEAKFLGAVCKRIETEIIKDIKKPMTRAVGCFNWGPVRGMGNRVFELLSANSKPNKAIQMNDPEIRRYCVKSLIALLLKCPGDQLTPDLAKLTFDTFTAALNDYTVDKRGDIGLVVREEVLDCYMDLWTYLAHLPADHPARKVWIESYLTGQVGGVITQLLEPNDRLRLKAGFRLQQFVSQHVARLPEFPLNQVLTDTFDSQLLRKKFQEHQDRFFENYDVSLIDDKNFLSYKLNDQFVYFWNIPKCTFGHVDAVLLEKSLNYSVLKGLVLSVACPIEATSSAAYEALKRTLEGSPEIQDLTPQNILKLLKVFRNKEKFFTSCMKTLQMILKNDLLGFNSNDVLKEVLAELKVHMTKAPSAAKLSAAVSVLCPVLMALDDLDAAAFQSEYKPLVEGFLFSEFPFVRKIFFEEFYMFLSMRGEELLGEEAAAELSEFLSNPEVLDDEAQLRLLRQRWTDFTAN